MSQPSPEVRQPQQRLIEAAGVVFGRKGYEQATVREIVNAAGMNIAAVNYYFGDKAELYRTVLAEAQRSGNSMYSLEMAGREAKTPHEELRQVMRVLMMRFLDQRRPTWHMQVIMREVSKPSGLFDALPEQIMRPNYTRVRDICSKFLGPRATQEDLRRGAVTLYSLGYGHRTLMAVWQRLDPARTTDDHCDEAIYAVADYLSVFAIAGLEAIRKEIDANSQIGRVERFNREQTSSGAAAPATEFPSAGTSNGQSQGYT